ncbi:pantetheine-phosphate adenylyltransferase [Desulfohalovibrio reitneri]|uniref:pantetheine-phosphate adenylyltransferase n=1 Tax=Desulfohalovibrio reitneri TaxID=1307759 RepID=UPI0004A75848|nr:pantetheine-phosphate adenylyltransferase [Desulfohalovibrio reitneri]
MANGPSCVAVYPGTFDPLTNGHVSLVRRGLTIFKKVVVAVAKESSKNPLFNLDERVEMAREVFARDEGVEVEPFHGLLVDYVSKRGANVILRGMRAVSDFEYEFQMALMNRKLNREVQTVFLMTDFKWMYLSSTIIKQTARLDANIKGLVPDEVLPRIYARYADMNRQEGEGS